MSDYADVTVIIDGALHEERQVPEWLRIPEDVDDPEIDIQAYVRQLREETAGSAERVEVYVLWHDHSPIHCPRCGMGIVEGSGQEGSDPLRCSGCTYVGPRAEFTECECAQHVADHSPAFAWGGEEGG